MQDAPNVDDTGLFEIEDQTGESGGWPSAQPGHIELMRIARRAGTRVPSDMEVGTLEFVNEAEGGIFRALFQIVRDDVFDVAVRLISRDDCSCLHFFPPDLAAVLATLRTLARRPSK